MIQLIEASHKVITKSGTSLVFRLKSNHIHDTADIESRHPCNHTTRVPRLGTLFRTRWSITCSRVNSMKQETIESRIERRTGIILSEARRTSSVVVFIHLQWRSRAENKETSGVPGGIFANMYGALRDGRLHEIQCSRVQLTPLLSIARRTQRLGLMET